MRNLINIAIVVGLALVIGSCTSGSKSRENSVNILYPNWAEGVAFTYLAKAALENKGQDVEVTSLEPGLIFGELSKDNSKGDICMDAWLPFTHKDYWEDYGDKLVVLGESFSEGTTGLVVPSYVTINSIEELNAHKDQFDGKIIGIGSGAGIHANTLKAIDEYELDFEQISSSGPAMVASLDKAVKNKKWTVITGWKPHFKWANFDLKYLADPKGIYPTDRCTIISRRGFEEDNPEAGKFFKNFNLTEDQLYDLMAAIKEQGEEAGAKQWYESNKSLVDSWF